MPGQLITRDTVRRLCSDFQIDKESFEYYYAQLQERSKSRRRSRRVKAQQQLAKQGQEFNVGTDESSLSSFQNQNQNFQNHNLSPGSRNQQQMSPNTSLTLALSHTESQMVESTSRLPCIITFHKDLESQFLNDVFTRPESVSSKFRLAPAYILYLGIRHVHTATFNLDEQAFQDFLLRIANKCEEQINNSLNNASLLAYWMANSSELMNFVRQDTEISSRAIEAQKSFAKCVQLAFRNLVNFMTRELDQLMNAFLADTDDDLPNGQQEQNQMGNNNNPMDLKILTDVDKTTGMWDVLRQHSQIMSLLRKNRVNAALTIQFFSQLFHFINTWLINKLFRNSSLCTAEWAYRFRIRLSKIESWAEKQGLELAADCHLAKVHQSTFLLETKKMDLSDFDVIVSVCHKLNSLQFKQLLENFNTVKIYQNQHHLMVPQELITNILMYASDILDREVYDQQQNLNHSNMPNQQPNIELFESVDLQVPFLLPEDGYVCDTTFGVPESTIEFITPLVQAGICVFSMNPHVPPDQSWTVYFEQVGQMPNWGLVGEIEFLK